MTELKDNIMAADALAMCPGHQLPWYWPMLSWKELILHLEEATTGYMDKHWISVWVLQILAHLGQVTLKEGY